MARLANVPYKDEFAVPADKQDEGTIPRLVMGFKFGQWLGSVLTAIDKTPKVEANVIYPTGSAGNIAITPFKLGTVPAGLYRVTFRFRITQPATTNSALQFFVTYTNNALPLTGLSTNETGNLATSVQAGALPIRVDASTAISYGATYLSVGATPMQYELDAVLESLKLDTV